MTGKNPLVREVFDYDQLDPDVREKVQATTATLHTLEKQTAERIVEMGKLLIAVRSTLPHGQFGPWLAAEFAWSERTAQNFMRTAVTFGSRKPAEIAAFSPTALIALAAGTVPDPVRDSLLSRAEAGERVTHQDVESAVQYYKKPRSRSTLERVMPLTDNPKVELGKEEPPPREPSTPAECEAVIAAVETFFASLKRADGRRVNFREVFGYVDSHMSDERRDAFIHSALQHESDFLDMWYEARRARRKAAS